MHPPRKIKENKKQIMFDAFKKYAVFTGRSSRTEYWIFHLICFLSLLLAFLFVSGGAFIIGSIAVILIALGILIPYYAVLTRRFHDINASGWWAMSVFILDISLFIFGFVAATAFGAFYCLICCTDCHWARPRHARTKPLWR
ncbi:MAG: DUF805 domain-containing protein [Pseudomonadota bacterium]